MCGITRLAPIALLLAVAVGCSAGSTGQAPAAGTGAVRPALRVPAFGNGAEAPTVHVLPSVAPTLVIQIPLGPAAIQPLYPNATGIATVLENPSRPDGDTLIVDVRNMPPDTKFTIFLTELAGKPFGHAEYVGDLVTRADGSGEGVSTSIVLTAFAADNRSAGTSPDQLGQASGTQLEHIGMWFDGVDSARFVEHDPTIAGTPFDGGGGPLHAGPQAMTDGQTLPVI
jgi:hypothetical protein